MLEQFRRSADDRRRSWVIARSDIALAAVGAAPLLGDLMRHTIEPLFGRATAKVIFAAMFHPLPIPARFRDQFPGSLSFRAEQLRAGSEEGVMMSPASALETRPA